MRVVLASRSAGRADVLAREGVDFVQVDPPYDDPAAAAEGLDGVPAAGSYAREMAARKLASCADVLADTLAAAGIGSAPVWVVAADTVCVGVTGRVLGKPADATEAAAMLQGFADAEHAVATGVALARWDGTAFITPGPRPWFEIAWVTWGTLDPIDVGRYVASGQWRGKSGGYNLTDRVTDGWPITVNGDQDTVVGLPWRAIRQVILNANHAAVTAGARP